MRPIWMEPFSTIYGHIDKWLLIRFYNVSVGTK